jgi:TRAP-type uncharacterized transport system substrate-binding protein
VRYLKRVDIGLTQLSVLNSYRSFNQLMGKYDDKIVLIAKLFNEEVHLIAARDITTIEQLNGRKVNIDVFSSASESKLKKSTFPSAKLLKCSRPARLRGRPTSRGNPPS